jgi:hypothetical protein
MGLQNNPDYVPSAMAPGEACRFLPTEGTSTILSETGTPITVEYPGLAQALSAVVEKLVGLTDRPKIVAPELSSIYGVSEYLQPLDPTQIGAIGHHMYGTDPSVPDVMTLGGLNQLGQNWGLPLFQTEMQGDGLGTAILMHYALAVEGVSLYLHSVLAGPASTLSLNYGALIELHSASYALEDAYHAVRHFARYTDPGWVRVSAASDPKDLLVSAWLSPGADALTVVLINAGTRQLDARLELGEFAEAQSTVIRSTFDGIERSSELGSLPAERTLRLPSHSTATVALRK